MGNTSSYVPALGHIDASSPEYWRHRGDTLAKERNECYELSKAAYQRGDHGGAKHWSAQGREKDRQSKECHQQASEMYLERNNATRAPGEVDLHGLRVSEALAVADRVVKDGRASGKTKVVLIVGRGLHSKDGIAKLRPAIEELIKRHNLRCTPGVPNEGCVTVEL